jgi:hypothetical protein
MCASAALLGCGSSGSSTATSISPSNPNAPAHSELVARADAICKQANDRIVATKKIQAAGQGVPYADVVRLLNEELPILTAEVNALRRLGVSGSDREAFAEYLRATSGELAAAARVRDAATRQDASGYRGDAVEVLAQLARSVQVAHRLGLAECAEKPEPRG